MKHREPPTDTSPDAGSTSWPSDFRAAFFRALTKHGREPLPTRLVQSVVPGPDAGQHTFPTDVRPDYWRSASILSSELGGVPAAQTLPSSAGLPPGAAGDEVVGLFAARYLEITGAFRPDVAAFARVWQELEDYAARETVPFRFTAPLHGFTADFTMLAIADGVAIEKVTPDWLASRWEG